MELVRAGRRGAVNVAVLPGSMLTSNDLPSSAVTVCVTVSLFVTVTVAPGLHRCRGEREVLDRDCRRSLLEALLLLPLLLQRGEHEGERDDEHR